MEAKDVAMLLAGAVVGIMAYKYMKNLSCREGGQKTETERSQQTEELEKSVKDDSNDDEESEEEYDLPSPENIKNNYTLSSGKFKMVFAPSIHTTYSPL
jgi:flagellar biosynthesis/type III secretory pathway M-ring protein FliF/YscJ